MRNKTKNNLVRLMCPICDRPNGHWSVNFEVLHGSRGSVSKRKRCKRCQVRLLYKATYMPETDKVAVNVLMDDKAKRDVAKHFDLDVEDVEEAIDAVQSSEAEEPAVRGPELPRDSTPEPTPSQSIISPGTEERPLIWLPDSF